MVCEVEMLVRMDGAVELILKRLLDLGYYKTKSEAIRAGILRLGREHEISGREARLVARKIRRLDEEAKKSGTKMIPFEKVLKKYGLSERDLR